MLTVILHSVRILFVFVSFVRCCIGVFGPGSLKEVFDRGGDMKACKGATKSEPCSRYSYTFVRACVGKVLR